LRLNRRKLRDAVRLWNQRAHHRAANRQKQFILSSRTTTRKISASIRCWFYRISCLRGARCTYLRKLRHNLHRAMQCWGLYASKRRAVAVKTQARSAAKWKVSFAEWRFATFTSSRLISCWISVVTAVYCSIAEERKRVQSHSISRLYCTWKASALLKSLSAKMRKALVVEVWRDWPQPDQITPSEVAHGRPFETLDTVVSKWADWADSISFRGCKIIQLRAQSKRARLLSFCRAWTFQARSSAARFRVEVSFGVWRVHARLQRSILSYIYKRGAMRARRIVSACLWGWVSGTKRSIIGRRALKSYCHVLLCTTVRNWASQVKSLVLHRSILTKVALHSGMKRIRFCMNCWMRFWKRKIAWKGVREIIVNRTLLRNVRKWLSWTRKRQWLNRIYMRKRVRVIHKLLVRMLQYARSRQACSISAQFLIRKQHFRFAQYCMNEWSIGTHKILYYAACRERIQQMRLRNLLCHCFLALTNVVLRCKRHCAIQVLIVRSNIAATLKRCWLLWCHEVQMDKVLYDHLMNRSLKNCGRVVSEWSSTARRASVLYQRLEALNRKFKKTRRHFVLHLWQRFARHQSSIRNKCWFVRRKIACRLKFRSLYCWSRCIELQHEPTHSSGLNVWNYINKVVWNRQKAAAAGLCARVTDAWKRMILRKRSFGVALTRIGRHQRDLKRILTFRHWSMAHLAQRHRWSTFERMRSRNALSRLCQAFRLWIDLAKQGRRANLQRRRRLTWSTFAFWKAFVRSFLHAKYVLKRREKNKASYIQRYLFLLWMQLVDDVRFTLRTMHISRRPVDRDMANHFFMLWVRCLPDSQTRADVTSKQEQHGDEVERLREEIAGLEEEVEDMKRKTSETQRELAMQVQGAEESISSLAKEVEDARGALAEEKEQRGDEVERLREEIAGLEDEVEDMKRKASQTQRELEMHVQGAEESISSLAKEVEVKMNFVLLYIRAKQKSFAFRRLRASFLLWCDRLVRRRLIEHWTIHIFAKKRLRRIEKNACSQYLQRLLARGFRRIGHWVHERRKFHQKIGELRSDFTFASVLLPASPLRAGELRVFCLEVERGPIVILHSSAFQRSDCRVANH
jgi:hypothetical protein